MKKDLDALIKKKFLTEEEVKALDKLLTELRASWPGSNIKVFGSKVKGMADEESDLDVLILLPCDVTEEIRRQIVHRVFDINLIFETNISALIMPEKEWNSEMISLLPIHAYIEEEGIAI